MQRYLTQNSSSQEERDPAEQFPRHIRKDLQSGPSYQELAHVPEERSQNSYKTVREEKAIFKQLLLYYF